MGLCNELWQSGDILIFLAISLRVWFSVFLLLGGRREEGEGGREEGGGRGLHFCVIN